MADPYSIITGTVGLVDVCIKLVKFIHKTRRGIHAIDEELRQLVTDIESLQHAGELIRKAFEKDMANAGTGKKTDTDGIWSGVSCALKDSEAALIQLDSLLEQAKGEEGSSTLDRLKRHFKKLSKDGDFEQLRQRLDQGRQTLQMFLTALSMSVLSFSKTERIR